MRPTPLLLAAALLPPAAASAQSPVGSAAVFAGNGHRYMAVTAASWEAAEAFAQARGGHLASIADAQEHEFVRVIAENVHPAGSVWIGLSDAAAEGAFVWSDGSASPYRAWAPAEPAPHDFVAMGSGGGAWRTLPADAPGVYAVIEVPLPLAVGPGRPFPTIQAAIDQALSGEEILVEPGTYTERIATGGKSLFIRSAAGPEATVIDGGGVPAVAVADLAGAPGLPGTLQGFTITGGHPGAGADNGGGVRLYEGYAVVNCVITGNTARRGGGVAAVGASPGREPHLIGCVVAGNTAQLVGGGIEIAALGRLVALNCTVAHNTAPSASAVLNAAPAGSASGAFINTIVWGHSGAAVSAAAGANVYERCHLQFGLPGGVLTDPVFAGPGDYRISPGSPCIDAGTSLAGPGLALDAGGRPRFGDDPATPDTGIRPAPVVDIGAYEYQPAPPPPPCPVDMDANGQINSSDISAFLARWLAAVQGGC